MAILVYLVLFLAMTDHSSATYCICKDGVGDSALQKALDYACGAGADCSAILQNGACYNPNTVKDHCSYAVNSYFQKKGQVTGSCDFSGAATPSTTAPSSVPSGCVYQASPSSTTPSTTTPSTTTPSTTTPSTTTPSTTTPSTTTPSTSTGGTGTTPSSVFGTGLGPTGTGISSTDSTATSVTLQNINLFSSLALTLLWISGFLLEWGENRR